MPDAVIIESDGVGWLSSPTVGTWYPAVGQGTALVAGALIGRLRRAGRWVEVTVPGGVSGATVLAASAGVWVAYGEPLVGVGDPSGVAQLGRGDEPDADAGLDPGHLAMCAETDGTVYLSPEPGQPGFAPVGAAVAARDTVALVEVMKTFTPVRAPSAGVVHAVLVRDGDAVTAGQRLVVLAPPAANQ